MQLATSTSDHGAKGNAFADLVGYEISVRTGRRVVAEPAPSWRPRGRIPLEAKAGVYDRQREGTHKADLAHGGHPVRAARPQATPG